MTELGYATLPRGRRLPPTPTTTTTNITPNGLTHHHHHHHHNGHLTNPPTTTTTTTNHNHNQHVLFHLPTTTPVGNCGGSGSNSVVGNGMRAIHDGFATIRAGGNKRGRSRSTPSVITTNPTPTTACHHPCCHPSTAPPFTMEPLWEERGGSGSGQKTLVARRDRSQLPWWEVATRRSRYRSCPAFSQASMVSALEQTMTSVTDRLERLASSPDLKETEAAELRKTAAVLRQQSTAVCQTVTSGCHSMERQLSCDSVSSVTSTVSGASLSSYTSLASHSLAPSLTPHCSRLNHTHATLPADPNNATSQAKLKKRSWLRSSFRRAFSRNGRKRKQGDGVTDNSQELPLHHTINTAVTHLATPPPQPRSVLNHQDYPLHHTVNSTVRHLPTPPPQQRSTLKKKNKGSGNTNVFEESELVSRLILEVREKEQALTEARLEVLSAQHQLQSQADTIAKLQSEVVGLIEENKILVEVVKGHTTPSPSSDHVLSSLTHTFSTLTLKKKHNTNGIGVSSIREDGRPVKILVVNRPSLCSASQAAEIVVDAGHVTHIANITVGSKTTWDDLDNMVINSLKDYGNRVDPVSALGMDNVGCVLCYRVEGVVTGPGLPRPELLPCGYCVGHVDALHVWLKGVHQKRESDAVGNLSTACFTSLTPAHTLTPMASLLLAHPRLVLAGPPASGKTHLARTLAEIFVLNSGQEPNEDNIKVFKVTGDNSLELCQMLSSMWPRGMSSSTRSNSSLSSTASSLSSTPSCTPTSPTSPTFPSNSGIVVPSPPHSAAASTLSAAHTSNAVNMDICPSVPPAVIILDDLHAASGVVETLQRCLPSTLHTGPAVIATCCPTASLSTRLHIHCNFRWTTLSMQQEPVRGLLGRALRRKVAAAEVAANTRLPDAHHLAEWLTRLWLHLNTLLSGHCGSNDVGIGPGLLIDCPLGQEETQAWFTEVWNSRLVPYIVSTLRTSASTNTAVLDTWTDPLDWVLTTYPWPNNAACGSDQLLRISASDIRPKEKTTVSTSRPSTTHRPYPSFSIRKQNRKPESVYAVPQLLPRSPAINLRSTQAPPGQSIRTIEQEKLSNADQNPTVMTIGRENKLINNHKKSIENPKWSSESSKSSENTRKSSEPPKWSSESSSDNLATIRRARSKSCTTSAPKPLTISGNGQNVNGTQMVITTGIGNNKFPIFTFGKLSSKSQENVSNQNKALVPTLLPRDSVRVNIAEKAPDILEKVPIIADKVQNIVENVSTPLEDEDEIMEDDCQMDNYESDSTDESDIQSVKSVDSRHNNLNCGNKMELEKNTDSLLDNTEPQNLEVLAKNVLNNNGLSQECLKIIHNGGHKKINMKGMAQEMTTTFKPVESAM